MVENKTHTTWTESSESLPSTHVLMQKQPALDANWSQHKAHTGMFPHSLEEKEIIQEEGAHLRASTTTAPTMLMSSTATTAAAPSTESHLLSDTIHAIERGSKAVGSSLVNAAATVGKKVEQLFEGSQIPETIVEKGSTDTLQPIAGKNYIETHARPDNQQYKSQLEQARAVESCKHIHRQFYADNEVIPGGKQQPAENEAEKLSSGRVGSTERFWTTIKQDFEHEWKDTQPINQQVKSLFVGSETAPAEEELSMKQPEMGEKSFIRAAKRSIAEHTQPQTVDVTTVKSISTFTKPAGESLIQQAKRIVESADLAQQAPTALDTVVEQAKTAAGKVQETAQQVKETVSRELGREAERVRHWSGALRLDEWFSLMFYLAFHWFLVAKYKLNRLMFRAIEERGPTSDVEVFHDRDKTQWSSEKSDKAVKNEGESLDSATRTTYASLAREPNVAASTLPFVEKGRLFAAERFGLDSTTIDWDYYDFVVMAFLGGLAAFMTQRLWFY